MELSDLADILDGIGFEVSVSDDEPTHWAGIHLLPGEVFEWKRHITLYVKRKDDETGE